MMSRWGQSKHLACGGNDWADGRGKDPAQGRKGTCMDTTQKPYRCWRCRTRRHLSELVERRSGDHIWLLCAPCAGFHDTWESRTATQKATWAERKAYALAAQLTEAARWTGSWARASTPRPAPTGLTTSPPPAYEDEYRYH